MPFETCAASNTGRVRDNNEDMFLVGHHCSRQPRQCATFDGRDFLLAAVADGMGGHAHGEIASERALQMLDQFQREGRLPARPEDHRVFHAVLTEIHQQIVREQVPGEAMLQMGATLVGAWFLPEGRLIRFHAGDSRLYRWRDGRLDQLTEDHTIRNQMLRSGTDPGKISSHLVTSCLGGGVETPTVDTEAVSEPVTNGDRYLLCSDGLTDMLSDDQIAGLLAEGSAEDATDALVAAALAAGGLDNITVVVVRIISDQAYDRDHR